jgi:hypothetical protein
VLLKKLYGAFRKRIVAVGNNVTVICCRDGFDYFRMNTGVVVTGKATF